MLAHHIHRKKEITSSLILIQIRKSSKFEFESVRMPRAKLRVYAYHRRPHRRVSQNGLESHVSPRDQIGVMRMVREKIIRGKKHS